MSNVTHAPVASLHDGVGSPSPAHPSPRGGLRLRLRGAVATHWLFGLVFLLAAALRLLTALTYRPALEYVQDSFDYLGNAHTLVPSVIRPAGYPFFLKVLGQTSQLAVVPVVQHLLGLATGVLVYAVVHRLGARWWLAALAAAPLLLDSYQIYVEQFVLAETLFTFLTVLALAALLWSERVSPLVCVAVGVLLATAALTRTVGLAVLVPAVAYLLVRRAGVLRLACLVLSAGLVLVGYASWFKAEHGHVALEAYSGYFLAGRVEPFAQCTGLSLPPAQQALCDPRPVQAHDNSDWYVWNPGSPLRRPVVPAGTDRNAVAGDFARAIIRHQPGDYLRTVTGDVLHYFRVSRQTGPQDGPVATWRFRQTDAAPPWQPEYPPADPYVNQWTWPGAAVIDGVIMGSHGFNDKQEAIGLDRQRAGWLAGYQRFGYTPGPLLALGFLLGLLAGVGRLRREDRRLRWAAALCATGGLLMLLTPAVSASFDYRYILPALPLMSAAGVLGVVLIEKRLRARREAGRTGDGRTGDGRTGDGSVGSGSRLA
ncbi:MAG: phospholipid carrier-dependent glycosyltransferase [Actinomycetota bacterium]|nr:phospholipid carrier-dependent glycosyltransferase [Actinomycetota bacterium]